MNLPAPEIVERRPTRLIALADRFTPATRARIPELWQRLFAHDFGIEGLDRSVAYGASFSVGADGSFRYAAGFEAPEGAEPGAGACIVTLAGGPHARFRDRVPMAAIPAFFDAAFREGLAQLAKQGWRQGEGAVFERYPP
ncbi:MAG: AraC family transcriptional regulator, partial [Alphaproteobacteria bacterium]